MERRTEWKKSQITRAQFNDAIYLLLADALKNYKTNPPHERYNDARLVTREILDNVYKHNRNVFTMGLSVKITSNHVVEIKITHDGDYFDAFADENECLLLKQLNYEYQFNSRFIGTDSGRFSITLKFDMGIISGGQNGSI